MVVSTRRRVTFGQASGVTVTVVALSVLVGAALQSATGFGFALVTAPAMFAVFTPGEALTLLVILATLLSVLVLLTERRDVDIRWADALPLAAWGIPGLALGIVILRAVDKPSCRWPSAGRDRAAALQLRGQSVRGEPRPWPRAPVGLAAGTLATTVGVNGPPMVMYLLRTGADQHQVRDTMSATFLLYTPLVIAALILGGGWALATSARRSWPGCWHSCSWGARSAGPCSCAWTP